MKTIKTAFYLTSLKPYFMYTETRIEDNFTFLALGEVNSLLFSRLLLYLFSCLTISGDSVTILNNFYLI